MTIPVKTAMKATMMVTTTAILQSPETLIGMACAAEKFEKHANPAEPLRNKTRNLRMLKSKNYET